MGAMDAMGAELEALRRTLESAGGDPPTGRELAELIWLARHMTSGPDAGDGASGVPGPEAPPLSADVRRPGSAPPPGHTDGDPLPDPDPDLVPLRTSAPASVPPDRHRPAAAGAEASVLAPAPPMIARPLALQRALRPLRRTVPSVHEREFDEAATAHRIAALGARRGLWLPELRPRRERWLHLRIVLDTGPTMAMWRPLARDLHQAFGQTGAFRTVEVQRLGADGKVPARPVAPARTAVLVLSDCMGPQWREGPAGARWYGTLNRWARELPLAVVQPLPERLWQQAALIPVPGLFSAPGPGAAAAALRFEPYDGGPVAGIAGIPVPVLEASPEWFGNWAALVAGPGGAGLPGSAALLGALPPPAGDQDGGLVPEAVGAEELVLRFRSLASPQAFRLAAHLAVGPPSLPVMRLVHTAVEEHPRPQHLAEVVLSGMLTARPGGGPEGTYDFRPGVRDLLLGALPRTALARTVNLLERVGAQIEARAGAVPGEFRALVGTAGPGRAGEPFALVSRESIRLLRGPEPEAVPETVPDAVPETVPDAAPEAVPDDPRLIAGRYRLHTVLGRGGHAQVWLAHDTATGTWVAVRRLELLGSERAGYEARVRARALREARRVAALRHDGITLIHDFGVHGNTFYLVMELLEGRDLRELLEAGGGRPLPASDITDIARQVLAALTYAHERGVWHRDLTPSKIVLLPDGTVKIRGFGILQSGMGSTLTSQLARAAAARSVPAYLSPEQAAGEGADHLSDLYALGCVLYELATGAPPFDFADDWQTLVAHRDSAPRPPRELRPELPRLVADAILRLLAKDPEERLLGARVLTSPQVIGPWQYAVLGPLTVLRGRENLTPGAATARILLARLLVEREQWLSLDDLRAALGPGHPEGLLAELIDGLAGLGHVIEHSGGLYRLRLAGSELDLRTAERLAAEAGRAVGASEFARGAELYGRALDLWHGEPLRGIEGAWADERRETLNSWRRLLEAGRDMAAARAAGAGPQSTYRVAQPQGETPPRVDLPQVPQGQMPPPVRSDDPFDRGFTSADDEQPVRDGLQLLILRADRDTVFGSAPDGPEPDFLPALRGAADRTLGRVTGIAEGFAVRVAVPRGLSLPDVEERLTNVFAHQLNNSGVDLFPFHVVVHSGQPERTTLALVRGLAVPRSYSWKTFRCVVGLTDVLYQSLGSPEGYLPYTGFDSDHTAHRGWFRVLDPARQAPDRFSWLRRLISGDWFSS
ncbi:SAV_2336 N-terminal domain-related protein [Streptomyces sp. NPDC000410]|uniref:SAV_2336 N-terminal domain-related protein n=1 Tax=Streptomyces sp. NPDC000410 TaxID=3154254 RepID=UPI003319529E